ncbi:protein MAIN-LIKE 2-like [Papaver somniferum]|uniref:protein MAIN-LIKE 2-like n=1 Tax=Papaver somniferum TaxID=3469 RepID=UPI000E7042B4|nr:protein MAIN-LIKE 2-like [Papaver somniferum]
MDHVDWSRYEKLSQLSRGVGPPQHKCENLDDNRDINFRSSWKEVNKFYQIVVDNKPRASVLLQVCGFGSVFEFKFKYADKALTEVVCERWWKKTRTFHFREFEIGLTPLDFFRLTGIPIGGGKPIPELPKETMTPQELEAMDARYFCGVLDVMVQRKNQRLKTGDYDSKASTMRVSHLANYIRSRENLDNTAIADELTRIFLLWCIGAFLFADCSLRVDKRWCVVLDNLDVVGSYDWGTLALGVLYKHLDDWSSCKQKDLGGMSMILEFWYYFYFRNYQPVLKKSLKDDELDPHPAILLFSGTNLKNRGQVDLHKHSVSDARAQIAMTMGDAVIWDPWFRDSAQQHTDAFQAALEMSSRIFVFKCVKEGTRASTYLAERCMRQVLGVVVIP